MEDTENFAAKYRNQNIPRGSQDRTIWKIYQGRHYILRVHFDPSVIPQIYWA
jgi:hypothetical protein